MSIFTGIAFGFALGALAGAAIGGGDFEDGARGALIGASVLPFIHYEYFARTHGVIQGTAGLRMKTGFNFTSSNHDNSEVGNGFFVGAFREHSFGSHAGLRGEAGYSLRCFSLQVQTFLYSSLGETRKFLGDISFDMSSFVRDQFGSGLMRRTNTSCN